MSYATVADMRTYVSEAELAELTSDDGQSVDVVMLDALIADSSSEVDANLPPGATVPTGSPVVRRIVCLLTLYHLYARRSGIPSNDMRKEQFQAVRMFLFELRMGVVRL